MGRRVLLASFVSKEEIPLALEKITSILNISDEMVFKFTCDHICDYALTYNIPPNFGSINYDSIWPGTIPVHRKKQSNTIFSINALNELIKQENNGCIDRSFELDWEKYRNCFLLIHSGKLAIIKTRLVKDPI